MKAWEINIGLVPGILFGIRHYEDIENNKVDYVLYLGCFDICYTTYY
jgi:hypothetical protein